MAMVVLIRGYMEWPFVLQFSSSPFDFVSSSFWVPALVRSISMTLTQSYFLQCTSWWGRFRWPWDTFIDLFGDLLWCSRFCWLRGINLFLAVCFLGEVDFVDFKTRFSSPFWVTSFKWSRFCWPRGTNLFLQCASYWRGRSLWPWGTNLIFTVRLLQ